MFLWFVVWEEAFSNSKTVYIIKKVHLKQYKSSNHLLTIWIYFLFIDVSFNYATKAQNTVTGDFHHNSRLSWQTLKSIKKSFALLALPCPAVHCENPSPRHEHIRLIREKTDKWLSRTAAIYHDGFVQFKYFVAVNLSHMQI